MGGLWNWKSSPNTAVNNKQTQLSVKQETCCLLFYNDQQFLAFFQNQYN